MPWQLIVDSSLYEDVTHSGFLLGQEWYKNCVNIFQGRKLVSSSHFQIFKNLPKCSKSVDMNCKLLNKGTENAPNSRNLQTEEGEENVKAYMRMVRHQG